MALTNQLEEFNPDWAKQFQSESDLLKPLFGENLMALHHVGSTSIPGMIAKPEIDILVELKSDCDFQSYFSLLKQLGYRYRDDAPFSFGHWYFSKDIEGRRTHKLHLCSCDHRTVKEQIMFRDYLIKNPARAAAYGELKLKLAASNPSSMLEYLAGKTPFVLETLRLANMKNSVNT
ncbi:MAG: GrpB family protein [Pseudobdellovibrionaceae bacterium]